MAARSVMMAALLAAGLCGCTPSGQGPSGAGAKAPPPSVSQVDEMVVQTGPVALNWDERPGPDGLEVAVHLFSNAQKTPVPGDGTLVFTLYEGALAGEKIATAPAYLLWRYTGANLRGSLQMTTYGWGYAMRLGWDAKIPRTPAVTLVIQYVNPSGRTLTARPIVIPMSNE